MKFAMTPLMTALIAFTTAFAMSPAIHAADSDDPCPSAFAIVTHPSAPQDSENIAAQILKELEHLETERSQAEKDMHFFGGNDPKNWELANTKRKNADTALAQLKARTYSRIPQLIQELEKTPELLRHSRDFQEYLRLQRFSESQVATFLTAVSQDSVTFELQGLLLEAAEKHAAVGHFIFLSEGSFLKEKLSPAARARSYEIKIKNPAMRWLLVRHTRVYATHHSLLANALAARAYGIVNYKPTTVHPTPPLNPLPDKYFDKFSKEANQKIFDELMSLKAALALAPNSSGVFFQGTGAEDAYLYKGIEAKTETFAVFDWANSNELSAFAALSNPRIKPMVTPKVSPTVLASFLMERIKVVRMSSDATHLPWLVTLLESGMPRSPVFLFSDNGQYMSNAHNLANRTIFVNGMSPEIQERAIIVKNSSSLSALQKTDVPFDADTSLVFASQIEIQREKERAQDDLDKKRRDEESEKKRAEYRKQQQEEAARIAERNARDEAERKKGERERKERLLELVSQPGVAGDAVRDAASFGWLKMTYLPTTALLLGNALVAPTLEEANDIAKIAETFYRHGPVIYDADSLAAKIISDAIGRYGIGVTAHPETAAARGIARWVGIKNPYLRLKAFKIPTRSITTADSVTGYALAIENSLSVVFDPSDQWFSPVAKTVKELPSSVNLGIKDTRFIYTHEKASNISASSMSYSKLEAEFVTPDLPDEIQKYWPPLVESSVKDALEFADGIQKLSPYVDGAVVFGAGKTAQQFVPIVKKTVQHLAAQGLSISTGGSGGFMGLANEVAFKAGVPSIGIPISGKKPKGEEVDGSEHSLTLQASDYAARIPLLLHNRKWIVVAPGGNGTMKEIATALVLLSVDADSNRQLVFLSEDYYREFMKALQSKHLPPSFTKRVHLVRTEADIPTVFGKTGAQP